MWLGFRTIGFREWPLEKALEALARLGYEGIEMCLEHPEVRPEHLSEREARRWAERVQQAGLRLFSVSYHGDADSPAIREQNQERSIFLTAVLGVELLILNAPRRVPGDPRPQWEAFVSFVDERLLPMAEREGVSIAFEPEPGLLLNGRAEMLQLLSHLPHPALGVNLDVGHAWLTEKDVPETIRLLAPWLWQLHLADFPAGEHRHLPPGEGDMPLADILAALQEIGYKGPIVIDLFQIADDPVGYAARSLAAWRALEGKDRPSPSNGLA